MKLLISSLYQSKTYECNTDINVANELKNQLSLTLIEDSAKIDNVGIIFPEEGLAKKEKNTLKVYLFTLTESSNQSTYLQLNI